MKATILLVAAAAIVSSAVAAKPARHTLSSPDGRTVVTVSCGDDLRWSVERDSRLLLAPSRIALSTDKGEWGIKPRLRAVRRSSEERTIAAPVYRQAAVADRYNALTLEFGSRGDGYAVELRAYDDGVCYRFADRGKRDFLVLGETAEFGFDEDYSAYVPYVNAKKGSTADYATQFYTSFENTYSQSPLTAINPGRLIFAPMVVECADGVKLCITEADLESYPGMFLSNGNSDRTIEAVFAPVPDEVRQGGHNMLQGEVIGRKPYIAQARASRTFPWRVAVIADEDRRLADCDMVWRLGAECRIGDTSWIRPGKVAWDWWNAWGVYGVDFRSGINNDTYKYYIDFASQMGVEYVILDEGWSVTGAADLRQVVDEIDLQMLVDYASERNVGIILWAGYWALNRDIEGLCRHFAQMGVKGFKVDFMDRDDQQMVDFYYEVARTAAEHHLLVDFHGAYKPTGLSRTYPNVLNYEGVHGLEQMKWSKPSVDQVTYDVTIPFIRAVAGPMDYTQGAMRNAARGKYFPSNEEPMSQGTRCHQLAMYGIFDSPLNMMCDSPTAYLKERECASFIAGIPTVWDSTECLDGRLGEYAVMMRRRGNEVYIAGLNGWTPRQIDLAALAADYAGAQYEMFADGANADRFGADYRRTQGERWQPAVVTMAPGGGFIIKLTLQ